MADHWGEPGAAALLTGMGRDGAAGLLTLRRLGWLTIAQDEATSVVFGMPRAAAEIGAAALVLPIGQVAGAIAERVRDRSLPHPRSDPTMTPPAAESSLLTEHKVSVLLVDDQPIIGEAVRRMLAGEDDIAFHYCKDATQAVARATEIGPTVILQDLVMPEIDGLDPGPPLPRERGDPRDADDRPLDQGGAQDQGRGLRPRRQRLPGQAPRPPRAPGPRIRYHSRGYINLLQRNEAYRALQASQKMLAKDVAQAAKYVSSLLPEKLKKGSIRTDWRFIPSAALGGDMFGYDWVDDDHFALYLLDVSGHGVGAALLSVSALNALRSQSLPQTDFRDPGQVLTALNKAFQMDQQNGLFFTIWYGIYHRPTRRLDYAGGGHPPALLLTGADADSSRLLQLESQGPMVGAVGDLEFSTSTCQVDPFGLLMLYSDGAFEVERPDGSTWPFPDFVEFMGGGPRTPDPSSMDRLIGHARAMQRSDEFADDFSIVEFVFPTPD